MWMIKLFTADGIVMNNEWCNEQQESHPAWTQEAYRPPCSEYSFCCPILAAPPGWLTPPPGWPPPQLTDTPPGWPPPCEQTDRHVSKHYLPVVLRTRAVMNASATFRCPICSRAMRWRRYYRNSYLSWRKSFQGDHQPMRSFMSTSWRARAQISTSFSASHL